MASFIKTLVKSTVVLGVLCAVAFAQPKPKAAVYIKGNPEGRDALRSSESAREAIGRSDSDDVPSSHPSDTASNFSPDESNHKRASNGKAAEAREHRIDISSSFSYYFNTDGSVFFDSTAPADFKPTHMSNMSLSMGMNLYRGISAYLDLGINNQVMQKTIDWAGRLGSKYFDFQIEYNFIGGKVSYWNDANIGVNKNTAPDLEEDFDQTWVTVALMYRIPLGGFEGLVGLFYNYAKVPALIWVNRNSDDKESRFAFLDKSCPVTMYGIRLYWDPIGFKRIPDGLPRGWTLRGLPRFTFGLGFGFADPNDDVVAMATEKGGRFTDYSFATYYMDSRLSLNFESFNRFTENQIINFSLGFELHGFGYARNEQNQWKLLDNWSSIIVAGWGPIVRVGYAW